MLRAGIRDEKSGQPIRADFKSFGLVQDGQVVIFYGPTELQMENQLREWGMIDENTEATSDPRLDQEGAIRREHERVLIATVGLPRSGKTIWAQSQAHPIVSPDAIRYAIHGQRYIAEAEPFVWATAKAMVRALFFAGHKTVIVDATNNTRKRRDEWRDDAQWGLYFKVIPTQPQVCIERARSIEDEKIIPVIERMALERQPLQDDERIWP